MSLLTWKRIHFDAPEAGEAIWVWNSFMSSPTRFSYAPGLEKTWPAETIWLTAPKERDRPANPDEDEAIDRWCEIEAALLVKAMNPHQALRLPEAVSHWPAWARGDWALAYHAIRRAVRGP